MSRLVSLRSFVAMAMAPLAAEQPEWENQAIFRVNKEPPRAASWPFPDRDAADAAAASPWVVSLNHRPENLEGPIPQSLVGYDGP